MRAQVFEHAVHHIEVCATAVIHRRQLGWQCYGTSFEEVLVRTLHANALQGLANLLNVHVLFTILRADTKKKC
jgi:hypothetical protein